MVGSGQTKKLQPELLEYNFWRKYGGCTKEAEYTTQCVGVYVLDSRFYHSQRVSWVQLG